MLEQITDLPEGIDGVRAVGKVSKEDYERVMQPLLEEAHRAGRPIRMLYQFGPEFGGFTPGGAWADVRLGLQHLRLFKSLAVVSDVGWVCEAVRLVAMVMPCPVRVFPNAERVEAIAWLTQPPGSGGALDHRLISAFGVLVVEPKGPLRVEDFEALAAEVDPWIESNGSLNGIVVHAERFPGWENLGGLLRHLRFVREHQKHVRRVALATDVKLASQLPKLAEHFVKAEVKHFAFAQLDDAIAWASLSSDLPEKDDARAGRRIQSEAASS